MLKSILYEYLTVQERPVKMGNIKYLWGGDYCLFILIETTPYKEGVA